MKKCIVIGGGLAGLSTAVFLTHKGIHVELLEASPKLGGRTYSFKDKVSSEIIDNGQHILMGCYKDTLNFINLIKAGERLSLQKNLKVNFLKENFQQYSLQSVNFFYPINLLYGLLRYRALSLYERMSLIKFFTKIYFYSSRYLNKLTVHEWLKKENQPENLVKSFWEILTVGALNTSTDKASAKLFSDVLKKIFFRGNKASTIILPALGLSETFCDCSQKFIEERGGTICLLESVEEFKISDKKVISIKTSKRFIEDFDFVVSAIPYFSLKSISGIDNSILPETPFRYSTIIAIHTWLKENRLKDDFYGLINSPIHWIFNHKSYLTLVISNADYLADSSKEEIFKMAALEIEKYAGIKGDNIISYKIIKEKRATFVPSNDILNKRPDSKTLLSNLFLAGDWINTGFPSTIESAVKSGRIAAGLVISNCTQ